MSSLKKQTKIVLTHTMEQIVYKDRVLRNQEIIKVHALPFSRLA
jgi:hypothetical protein